ncbi:hypothetical protein [Mangrovimonas aestuarii]|uniref:hypothetical protein n=1 Tax=Mangrovimonas aestuarii TaxID=3018443 RepID=UPI0023790F1B|nr:hypothetical protein [Mangrovimonas aestuarii]
MTNKTEVELSSYYNEKENKTLVMVPMVHLNRPEFYDDVRNKLDSLRNEGFTVFYEGVVHDTENYSPEQNDTILWKFRKLIGFSLTTHYNDTNNKSTPAYFKNDKYVMQTKKNIGISDQDLRVDLSKDTIIKMYERENGVIALTECDYNTPLMEKYECESSGRHQATQTFRNGYIVKSTVDSPMNKIALVYGQAHFKWLKLDFIYNHGYREVKS